MKRVHLIAIVIVLVFAGNCAYGDDWPQWRYDANRSGASDFDGPAKGQLLWTLDLGRPDPAYDHQYRMCADVTYAPIAAEGLLFVPSNAADNVTAYNLMTGAMAWRFVAGGPVRFAAVYRNGRVYFGSDDGHLYCVTAGDGRMVWKVRGVPSNIPDAWMLVNGRMSSRWPLRGAPVEVDGVIYFGVGIWPEEGVYVCAVDAETGKVLWRSDSMSYVKDGMSDHGVAYDLSLPPQGYLAFIDGKVAVPSGRTLAAWFDPATGKMEPYTSFYVKTNPPRGTWSIFGVGQFSVQGGNWFATRADAKPPLPAEMKDVTSPLYWSKQTPENELYVIKNRPYLRGDTYQVAGENFYTEPILTKSALYESEFESEGSYIIPRGHTHVKRHVYDKIVARDLTRPEWTTVMKRHFAYAKKNLPTPRLEFPVLWELKSPLKVLAKAGRFLYAGGENTLAAIAIPEAGEKPTVVWQAKVNGYPVNALIADGVLAVVTDTGSIHCFGKGPPSASIPAQSANAPMPSDGYVLQLGWGSEESIRALADDEGSRVIVIEGDKEVAAAARESLSKDGVYGRRIQILEGDIRDLRLAPYWASQVIFGSSKALDDNPRETLKAALKTLRPYTGKLLLPFGDAYADLLTDLVKAESNYAVSRGKGQVRAFRKGPPTGSADWTHEMAGADNSFAGADSLVQWPLGTLWYSGDIDRFFTPATHFQHERNPHPLVAQGRMFLITGHFLHCIDIYTGSYLWKTELPFTPWVRTWYFDSRSAGRPTERSYVASDDRVYVVTGKEIHAYDTVTGKEEKVIGIPETFRAAIYSGPMAPETIRYKEKGVPIGWKEEDYQIQTAPEWTGVRLFGDLLFATLGPNLVALDRRSGELQWSRKSSSDLTVFAIGDERLFGLDFQMPPDPKRGPVSADTTARLFAVNPQTGETMWERETEYGPQKSILPKIPNPWNLPAMPGLAVNAKHGLLLVNVDADNVYAVSASDGSPVWSRQYASGGYRLGHMVATEDHLMVSGYDSFAGYLLDITTGEELGDTTGIPRTRSCGMIIGNSNLLVYRDSTTELYDIHENRMIGFNSVRSGCTTSFFPAGGIMNAPMLGHGCVCNFPMFSSLALYHLPWMDEYRPKIVKDSWVNEAEALAPRKRVASSPTPNTQKSVDITAFKTINCTLEASGNGVMLTTQEGELGYAIKKLEEPARKAVFRFSVARASAKMGEKRHENAFFVCGQGDDPKNMVECRIHYGGKSTLSIVGAAVEATEVESSFHRNTPIIVNVRIDCEARTVTLETAGKKITAPITAPIDAITHYGYGGSNSANIFTRIKAEN